MDTQSTQKSKVDTSLNAYTVIIQKPVWRKYILIALANGEENNWSVFYTNLHQRIIIINVTNMSPKYYATNIIQLIKLNNITLITVLNVQYGTNYPEWFLPMHSW